MSMGWMDWIGTPFRGITDDYNRRAPHYYSDWTEGLNLKLVAAIFFMFFTSIGPAITFAVLLQDNTEKEIGVVEVLLSSALSGGIFSIFAGQPLVIVGVTGPVTILTISVYNMADALGVKFLPFYAWAQVWAAIMHWAISACNLCDYIVLVTNFSCETFGVLIAIIYLYTGITGMVDYFDGIFADALLQMLLALGTAWLGFRLSEAERWPILNRYWRSLIADYGPTLSLILWCGISYAGKAGDSSIPRLQVPKEFETTSGRSWLIDLADIPAWGVFAALIPGLIITVLFVFDHNVSSLMAQGEALNLQKGSAYHLDFFVLGWCILVTGILGIPPCNGLIPQAPLHTKALSVTRLEQKDGVDVVVVEKVYEQRISNLSQASMTLMMCFPPFLDIIALIPQCSLDGLFLFMGMASFGGNSFAERCILVITEPIQRASAQPFFKLVSFDLVKKFTLVQLGCVVIIFAVTLTPAAMLFPLLIAALVFLRLYVFPKYYDDGDLQALDKLNAIDRGSDRRKPLPQTADEDADFPAGVGADAGVAGVAGVDLGANGNAASSVEAGQGTALSISEVEMEAVTGETGDTVTA
jgi:hypothetical protein